jgi:hypothetical protein
MPTDPDVRRLQAESSLPNFFRLRLGRLVERFNLHPHDDTLWYLGNLLHRFGHSDQLFEYYEGRRALRPLALLYGDAQTASCERERCLLLQRLGDLALFLGAFFPERYARRGIRRDYFIGMGGGAYDYLADRAPQHRHVFLELTHHFTQMLELVAAAGSRQGRLEHGEILSLYARWVESGNQNLARQLQAIGIQLPEKPGNH